MLDPQLREAIDAIAKGYFSPGDNNRFRPLVDNLLQHDYFFVVEDFSAYRASQKQVDDTWNEPTRWARASILNCARCGWFSSDRSIKEYCDRVWRIDPVPITQSPVL
jgi:starch phosphorylase